MRYHSPFMMKSDKSPPSSELSTRSSYQGQSLIKTGTYLHRTDYTVKSNSKPSHAACNYIYTIYREKERISLASTRLCVRLRSTVRNSTLCDKGVQSGEESGFGRCEHKRRRVVVVVSSAPLEKRAADRRKTGSLPLKIAFRERSRSARDFVSLLGAIFNHHISRIYIYIRKRDRVRNLELHFGEQTLANA